MIPPLLEFIISTVAGAFDFITIALITLDKSQDNNTGKWTHKISNITLMITAVLTLITILLFYVK